MCTAGSDLVHPVQGHSKKDLSDPFRRTAFDDLEFLKLHYKTVKRRASNEVLSSINDPTSTTCVKSIYPFLEVMVMKCVSFLRKVKEIL